MKQGHTMFLTYLGEASQKVNRHEGAMQAMRALRLSATTAADDAMEGTVLQISRRLFVDQARQRAALAALATNLARVQAETKPVRAAATRRAAPRHRLRLVVETVDQDRHDDALV